MTHATIFAPHPDDELIGCWSLLDADQVYQVVYLFDHDDPIRRAEARACASRFDFIPHFMSLKDFETSSPVKTDGLVYLPARTDSHPDHKAVNKLRRFFEPDQLRFYSVDLQTAASKVLASPSKRLALDQLYPSQKALWENDASYYLFEALSESDIARFQGCNVTVKGVDLHISYSGDVTVTALYTAAINSPSFEHYLNYLAAVTTSFEVLHGQRINFVTYKG